MVWSMSKALPKGGLRSLTNIVLTAEQQQGIRHVPCRVVKGEIGPFAFGPGLWEGGWWG
jgi:hypothetical protein